MANVTIDRARSLIRDVPGWPRAGIVYKDITPLLADHAAFSSVVDLIVSHYGRGNVDKVLGIEARGYALAAPVAYHFGSGFVPARKEGRLPGRCVRQEYALEYGTAVMEVHADAIARRDRVLIVDDVLATGGTAEAAAILVERLGGVVAGISCLIELRFLHGRDRVERYDLFTLLDY